LEQVPDVDRIPCSFIEHLYLLGPLHDIGQIGIADSILLKSGGLNPEERALMNTHVQKGIYVAAYHH